MLNAISKLSLTWMVWHAWLPLLVRMADTAWRVLPVSPQATTRLKRQAQDNAVRVWPVGSFIPVLRTVVSSRRWKRDSAGATVVSWLKYTDSLILYDEEKVSYPAHLEVRSESSPAVVPEAYLEGPEGSVSTVTGARNESPWWAQTLHIAQYQWSEEQKNIAVI